MYSSSVTGVTHVTLVHQSYWKWRYVPVLHPLMLRANEKAHSCYFSEDTFKKLKGDNKTLLIIPGAVHVDLYDRQDVIPFDKPEYFFKEYL